MGRPTTSGLDFFPLKVDFFDDPKIIYAEEKHGIHGSYIATRLMAMIYREGYFMRWDDDSALIVSKRIGNGITSEVISNVLKTLLEKGLFDLGMYRKYGVLTSAGIQKRWLYVMETKRRKGVVNEAYSLVSSEETAVISEGITDKAAESTQTKRNETKLNKNTPLPPRGEITANSPEDEKSEMHEDWKVDFEKFWTAYGKKVDRAKCEQKFAKLKKTERVKLLVHVPEYVAATPDDRYRKNPATYLNNRCWNDENLPNGKGNPLREKQASNGPMIKAVRTTQHEHQWAIEYEDGTFCRITTSELDQINYGRLPLSNFDKEAV